MEQRTQEWLDARKRRVTASIAGAVLGLAPYMTRKDAMKTMLGISEFKGNVATDYGNFHEYGAAWDIEIETGLFIEKTGFHVHPEHDWLGASPDGFIGDDMCVEIKCPYGIRNDEKPVFHSIFSDELKHYYTQVQIQMFVTGRKRCLFAQWSPTALKIEYVDFDQGYIDQILPTLYAFYNEFLENESRDIGRELVDEYEELAQAIKDAEERRKDILAELVKMTGGEGGRIYGEKFLSQVERKGSVSYAKVVKEKLPDLDLSPWTGAATKYWMLK